MLKVVNLHKRFDEETYPLRGFDLEIAAGEVIALMGPSGSGKSTALNCIAGIDKADSGEVYLADEKIDYDDEVFINNLRKNELGIVFQQFYLLNKTTVYNQLSLISNAKKKDIEEILEAIGMKAKMYNNIEDCSGGQQQRAAIARALVRKPKLILADEPTANLDARLAIQSLELMLNLSKQYKSAVLIITHDDRIIHLCDKVYHLEDGKAVMQ